MSPRTGRPPSEQPKTIRVETKMSEEDLEKLAFCCEVTGKIRSEIIREGVEEIYKKIKDLHEKK